MSTAEAAKHHFVPRFLLQPWARKNARGHWTLSGYFWDTRRCSLACKQRGVRSFCFQLDLLTLQAHVLGRDALERVFFGSVDNKGAEARDQLLEHGPLKLTSDQRSNFGRLLLSLVVRRPSVVDKFRDETPRQFATALDRDLDIRSAMLRAGIREHPSSWLARHAGDTYLTDMALTITQLLTDDATVGKRLINSYWHVVRLGEYDEPFVLSDSPLIRLNGFDHPDAIWALPLTPRAAFVAMNNKDSFRRIQRTTPNRVAKALNHNSIRQIERFVFSVKASQESWIAKHLRLPSKHETVPLTVQ
jgi:hypothetical protein